MIWIIQYLIVIVAGLAAAYFECERLITSGRWTREQADNVAIKFWSTNQTSLFKKLFDSYHFMSGLTVISLVSLLFFNWKWFEPFIVFFSFWYIRNIGMLILFLKVKRWSYLSPILPNVIEKLWGH